jgi:lysozyme
METIRFEDAAENFKGLPHQRKAWDFLQKSVHKEILDEFARIYRDGPKVNYLVDIPKSGVDLIKQFEGCELKAYYDPLSGGLPITIGWGSTKRLNGTSFRIGDRITQQEADELLAKTLKKEYLPALQKIPFWNEMTDNQRGALLSFCYNMGPNFYGNKNFATISFVLKNKQWHKVPEVLYMYRNPGTSVEPGLAKRRKAEGYLWEMGMKNK